MRIKLYSCYDHFPRHRPIDGQPYISCYNDDYVMSSKVDPDSIALMIEPRSIQPKIYEYIEQHYDRFKYVFTHDSILLSCIPNAKLIFWGGVYEFNDVPKTKDISFCSSDKEMCLIHKMRKQLAYELQDTIDVMGNYADSNAWATTYDIYAEYRFSVVIENYIDDWWFSEKICNAFANKCVPIYFGARKIDKLFNPQGIIRADKISDIPLIIKRLKEQRIDWEYDKRRTAIAMNEERVVDFANFEDWFFSRYKLLGGFEIW